MRVLALATIAIIAPAAHADTKKDATAALRAGNAKFSSGDYLGALADFRRAYELSTSPKVLINIGTTLSQLGRFAEAVEAYERYLTEAPTDTPEHAEVEAALRAARHETGMVEIVVMVPDGTPFETTLDGRPLGGIRTVRVDPGLHTAVLKVPDREPVATSATVQRDTTVRLELVLRAEPVKVVVPVIEDKPAPITPKGPSRLAVVGRVDLDQELAGGIVVVGGSVRIAPTFDVTLAGLAGATYGGWAGASWTPLDSIVRPRLIAGVPLYVTDRDGAQFGVHVGGGAELALGAIGVRLELAIQYFPGASVLSRSTLFVPSLGASYRL